MSNDAVNHPEHYDWGDGLEVIQLTEKLSFCAGNAFKYMLRPGKGNYAEDLRKSIWYLNRWAKNRRLEDPAQIDPAEKVAEAFFRKLCDREMLGIAMAFQAAAQAILRRQSWMGREAFIKAATDRLEKEAKKAEAHGGD